MDESVERVTPTPAALALIESLKQRHGPALFFYQSGGCCEGSSPGCYLPGDLRLGGDDVRLGEVASVPFFVSRSQCEYLLSMQLTLDVAPGSLGTFSLEDADGHHFVTPTRLFSDEELAQLPLLETGRR